MSIAQASTSQSGGWRFALGGFDVHVPWNALIGIGIIAALWFPEFAAAASGLGQFGLAVAFGILLMASILLHELAHAVTARLFGYRVTGITLWAMGGFTIFRTTREHTPSREAAVAAAGPIATLAVAALGWAGVVLTPAGVLHDLLLALTTANLLVGVFNLLPGSPLDGGAIVRAIVWAISGSERTGSVVAAWIGRGLAVLIALSPFLLAFSQGRQPSLPLAAVGLILGVLLWTGATAALRAAEAGDRLGGVSARQLARQVAMLDSAASVTDALAIATPQRHVVVLGEQGVPVGVVAIAAAEAVPADARDTTPARTVCTTITSLPEVPPDATALEVLEVVEDSQARYLIVADHTDPDRPSLVGLIDADQVFVSEGP